MKIKISLDITDDRSERSARSSIRVGPPTDEQYDGTKWWQ